MNWIDRFARVTTTGRHIRELDGLRFIAISTVFVQHAFHVASTRWSGVPDLPIQIVQDILFGVELFFLISGFILALPFASHHLTNERPVSLRAYYWRRVTRLEPPYLLSLLAISLILVFYWGQSASALLPHFAASAFYIHNIGYGYFSAINPVAWSLEIEVQFYILAPALACVFWIRRRLLRRGIIIICTIALLQCFKLMLHSGLNMPFTLFGFLPYFLMGFLLADVYLTDWNESPTPSLWGDLVAVPGWLLLHCISSRSTGSAKPSCQEVLWSSFFWRYAGRLLEVDT
jgi:peptidoglycan/LPS O-acetylase OafA/YrhL